MAPRSEVAQVTQAQSALMQQQHGEGHRPSGKSAAQRPSLTVEELKEAGWKPSTHRAYAAKAKWWQRFLETADRREEEVDGVMLCDFVKYLFDESSIAPQSYPQYLSAVFHRLGRRHIPVPRCREF